MTLTRILAAGVSGLFLVVLLGVEMLNLRSAQTHLQRELESKAQDAATSLGLSLGTLLRTGDAALAETVINPVFDRGHYERIEYITVAGTRAVSKVLPVTQGDYPTWLVHLVPLDAPTAESMVSAGWRQLGKVRVSVHPRFAYEQLWASLRDTLVYLVALFAGALIALRLLLREILRPLVSVERAAQAISERNYVTLAERPRTRELSRVVGAMNLLSRKVAETIDAEVRRAERMQELALRDPVSGLVNARGFSARFESLYEAGEERFSGALAWVELGGLAQINARLGGERCDQLLRALARPIDEAAFAGGGISARWGGSRFALALPNCTGAEARTRLDALRGRLRAVLGEFSVEQRNSLYCAAIECSGMRLQETVALADDALGRAREQPDGIAVVVSRARSGAGGDATAKVVAALQARRLSLVGQPASRMSDHRLLHTEIFARLRDADGAEIFAAQFVPVIAAEGLIEVLDRAVVEAVMEAMRRTEGAVSVNLSVRSAGAAPFSAWLAERLKREPALAARLVFELPEHGVVQQQAAVTGFARAVREAGAGIALDHFGAHGESLAILRRLAPAYVKLAAAHTAAIVADAGARFLAESLVGAARGIEVPVIAQNIEDDDTFRALSPLGFGGYQGNLGGRPAPWPAT